MDRRAPTATKAWHPKPVYVLEHIGNSGVGVFYIQRITRKVYLSFLKGESVEYDSRQHYIFNHKDLLNLNKKFKNWGGVALPKNEIPSPVDGEEFRYIRNWMTVNDFSRFGSGEEYEFFLGRGRRPFDLREFQSRVEK